MAKGGGGFMGKPVKGTMSGKDFGKAVSTAAKAKTKPEQSAKGTSRKPAR
jgi:hypothetical protein